MSDDTLQEGDLVMLEHTLPTTPGALLGHRKDGTPFYLIAGGAPEEGEGQPQDNDPQAETTPPADPQREEPQREERINPDARRVDELPSWAQKLIKDARKEAGDYRTRLADAQRAADEATAKQGPSQEEIASQVRTDFAQQIGKALGIITEEEKEIDPQKVIETLTGERDQTAKERDQERERHRRALVELAVHRASAKVGADPDALLDSRSFLKAVRDMDPDANDFSTQLTETIQLAVENNPKFRLAAQAGPPARSGGEFTGGPGGRTPNAEPSIDDFRKKMKRESSR